MKFGDWVELKSGSPPLFISHLYYRKVDGAWTAIVVWINEEHLLEEAHISLVCFKPWVDEEPA
jgi:hypothetical protein